MVKKEVNGDHANLEHDPNLIMEELTFLHLKRPSHGRTRLENSGLIPES